MPHLNELKEKYESKGLLVMATSKEDKGKIEGWAKDKGAKFAFFVDDGGATTTAYGVTGYPSSVILGPDGKVIWKGHPSSLSEKLVEQALEKVVLRFGYEFPKAFAKVKAKIDKKDFAGALDALTAAEAVDGAEGAEGADAEVAAKIRADLVGYAEDVKKMALSDAEGGDYLTAEATLKELAKQYKGSEPGKAIDALLKEWKSDSTVKKEIKAGKMMLKGKAMEKAMNFRAALGIYMSVAKKYKGTKTAAVAEAKAEKIQDGSLWKIDAGCKKCTTMRSPCDKHNK